MTTDNGLDTADPRTGPVAETMIPNGHRIADAGCAEPGPIGTGEDANNERETIEDLGDQAGRISDDDDDDDSSIAPFPPYREPEDYESSLADEVVVAQAPFDSMPTPTSASDDGNNTRHRLFSDAAQPLSSPSSPTTTTSAGEADPDPDPSIPPSPVTAKPTPPPPYWTHSRDGSGSHHTTRAAPSSSPALQHQQTNGTGRPATAADGPPKPKFNKTGLSLFSASAGHRPATAVPSSRTHLLPNGSSSHPSSSSSSSAYHTHRRDTSSSTLDLNVNLITLQDNEAADNDDDGARQPNSTSGRNVNNWQLDGASNMPSALSPSSPPAGLVRPGPPPGSPYSDHNYSKSGKTHNISKSQRCWARRVDIIDYVVVNGGGGAALLPGFSSRSGSGSGHPRLGAFVVWTVRVETLGLSVPLSPSTAAAPDSCLLGSPGTSAPSTGTTFCIYKRYSEFDTLRRRLIASFPQARNGGALPALPPKSVLGKFRPAFLEQRRLGLQYFLK